MDRLFILLLRILFPFDKVARSREVMRDWLQRIMSWLDDPRDIESFDADPEDRAWLEGHIAALEYGMQVLLHERAREMLGLPFVYFPRQTNPKFRRAKDMPQLYKRITQLARNFHNLEKLAARRAERIKRDHDSDPLRLAATPQSTSPSLRLVEAGSPLQLSSRFASLSAQHWGRWIGASSRRDGGGACVFARGPPHSQLPIPNSHTSEAHF